MIEVILIDDEPKSLTGLEWELTNFSNNIKVIEKFVNPELALHFLKTHHVDGIFLDIEMPQMDGFQFLEQIKDHEFAIIFTTAYDQYAIKAIKERALDYLLKPIDADDLEKTIDKIVEHKKNNLLKKKLEERILSLTNNIENSRKKIAIPIDGKLLFYKSEDLLYCESDGNYCHIYLENNEKLFVTKKLKEVEEIVSNSCFFRIHNSYLINLDKVTEYVKADNYVVLNNQKKLPVSRNRKNLFLDKL